MSDNTLELYPATPQSAPADVTALISALHNIELIGMPFDRFGIRHYRLGGQFPQLIRFRRSHTVIVVQPEAGRLVEVRRQDSAGRCHIAFSAVTPEAEFLGMGNTHTPRCPHCKRGIRQWQAAMTGWYINKPGYYWICPHCTRPTPPAAWDWQKTAAIARFSIAVWGIHGGEARPTHQLLQFLATQVATPWDYFYARC